MFEPQPEWWVNLPEEPASEALERAGWAPITDVWLTDATRRSLGWTLLLSAQSGAIYDIASNVSGFRSAAIGLLSPEVDGYLDEDVPPFGVILYADASPERGPVEGEREPASIEAAGRLFPVVVRQGEYADHRGLPNGSAAYWASSRGGRHWGWLTAKHVADSGHIPPQWVVDRAPLCLDAALVNYGQEPTEASHLRHIPAFPFPTADLPVRMAWDPNVTARVLDVATTLGIAPSKHFPIRFSTSVAGQPGDSGSAIEEAQHSIRTPLGLYLGAFTPQTPQRGHHGPAGIGLSITQLEQLMQLEVFK
jgi:hypothetical protein